MNDGRDVPREVDAGSKPAGAVRLSDDRLYRALASTRRRRLLWFLLEEGRCTVEESVNVLLGWAAAEADTMKTPDDRRRLVIGLVHVHLPILEDSGIVSYDRTNGIVELETLDPPVEELIRRSVGSEPSARQ